MTLACYCFKVILDNVKPVPTVINLLESCYMFVFLHQLKFFFVAMDLSGM